MYSKINDVIQLSSENKITQKNAWNLGINVDSIMESALDEGIVDEKEKATSHGEVVMRRRRSGGFGRAGVNFQKASCKLDASVKIYSFRVDDTHASSYRILENLTRTNKDESEAPQHASVGSKTSSHKFGVANTLEKNPESLNSATNQELSVDPSFHKMSHLFDEGGAGGMLLHNLNLAANEGCRIAFGDNEQDMVDDSGNEAIIDVSSLQSRVERALVELSPGTELSGLSLCSELTEFRHEILNSGYEMEESKKGNDTASGQDEEDYEEDLQEDFEDYTLGNEEFADQNGEGDDDDSFGDDNGMPFGFSSPSPSPRRCVELPNELDLLVDNEYAFFDMSRMSSTNAWAGSSQWMFRKRRVQGSKSSTVSPESEDSAGLTSAPKSKARKGGLAVDFLKDEDEETSKRLAIPKEKKPKGKNGTASSTTELSAASVTKSENASFLLPEDAKLSPSHLARLFLRPHKQVRRHDGPTTSTGYQPQTASSPLDFNRDHCGDDMDDSFGDMGGDMGGEVAAVFEPFNMDDDVNQARMLAPERAVAKISVRHEIRAKKVDVRELKHQIWNDISPICETPPPECAAECTVERSFADVMTTVGEKNSQEGVTLPFYFICVLHLANEKGLKLEGNSELSDFVISSAEN
mmetsp:Transcript_53008/g.67951  ORF Transcript_53008/g.67951 Transcript_53008/m.67951 type:complete len:638 (+) Transcript_53008:187-2100(+)